MSPRAGFCTLPGGLLSSSYNKALYAIALVFALLCGASGEARAADPPDRGAPAVGAEAWALTDAESGEYLAGANASERLPMASTTKIVAALVVLEEGNLEEEATVSEEAAAFATPLYSNVGLQAGDVLSARELLMATLISSGDDAAHALAEHAGGGSVENFVQKMNRKADSLGLRDTHFENPIGLDDRGHYTSARDLAAATRAAFEHPEFRRTVAAPSAEITTQDRTIPLVSTNELLALYPPANGVKTGTTPGAGPTLVASAARGDESYIAVVLDDPDRFGSAAALLEHGFDRYDRRTVVSEGKIYAKFGVPYQKEKKVRLEAARSVSALVEPGSEVEREVEIPEELPGSARRGTSIGSVVVRVDGERVGESVLVARSGYEEASVFGKLWYTVGGFLR